MIEWRRQFSLGWRRSILITENVFLLFCTIKSCCEPQANCMHVCVCVCVCLNFEIKSCHKKDETHKTQIEAIVTLNTYCYLV